MKVTLNKYVNARVGAASTSAPCQFYRSPGDTLDVLTVTTGTEIDGNSVWYQHTADECFYWSGGVEEIVFTNIYRQVNDLPEVEAMQVLNQAKNYYWDYYRAIDKGINGILIGDKKQNNAVTVPDFSLVFQVNNKTANPLVSIPAVLNFKGFAIRTDVVAVSVSVAQLAGPGQSVSRILDFDTWGSITMKVAEADKPDPFCFLLTNYHVVGADLISSGIFNFNSKKTKLANRRFVVPSQFSQPNAKATGMGAFNSGLLSSFFDVALLMLDDKNQAANRIAGINGAITGVVDVFGNNVFKDRFISRVGATSSVTNKAITSVNANQLFSYNGGAHVEELKELIQLELCSQPGDSGSPVLLGDKIIGLLVGADSDHSYAIPIQRILNFFNLKIILP